MARCANCKKQPADQKTAVRIVEKGSRHTRELPYCSERCKQAIHFFVRSHNQELPRLKNMLMVWALIFLGTLLVQFISGNPLLKNIVIPALVAFVGLVLIIYPSGLMDLKYYERLGIKWFSLYVRITGLILVGVAATTMLPAY